MEELLLKAGGISGAAVLAAVVYAFITGKIVPAHIYQREVTNYDRLLERHLAAVETVKKQAETIEKQSQVLKESVEVTKQVAEVKP